MHTLIRDLIRDLIPHAPKYGLYVAPNIPRKKLRSALHDYAQSFEEAEVIALYDATLLGSGKDGALFLVDRFVFQNNDLEEPQEVKYTDLVQVGEERKRLGGRKVLITINRGRASLELTIDFSGRKQAAGYVARFLSEAMQQGAAAEMEARRQSGSRHTDWKAVRSALERLRREGKLTGEDAAKLLAVAEEG